MIGLATFVIFVALWAATKDICAALGRVEEAIDRLNGREP